MNFAKILKQFTPLVVAKIIFAIITIAYFAPQFSGDVIVQHDVQQYKGMTQDILENREATGEDAQWTGSMFGGMPAYLINVAYPAQLIKTTIGRVVNIVDTPAAFIFFAMLSMWLMLVMMGFNGWVAITGALMYGLSTYFFLIIEAGHLTKMWALVYAPLMFGGVYVALKGNMLVGASLAALFASLEISANHPQITYYFGLAIAAFWVSELYVAYIEKSLKSFSKRTGLLLVAAILAVGSNFAPLWYTYEHTPDTIRGGSELAVEADSRSSESDKAGLDFDYATAWSYGMAESFNMLIPNFVGGTSMDTFSSDGAVATALKPYQMQSAAKQLPSYWGDQPFTGGPTYIGAVVIFLAIFGLFVARGREKWWILAISILVIMLAWGRHFMWLTELMFNILPGYNKFRTVSMILVVVEWSMPLLAVYGLSKAWSAVETIEDKTSDNKDTFKKLLTSTSIIGGLLLIFIVLGGSLFKFGYDSAIQMLVGAGFPDDLASVVATAMKEERAAMLSSDALRALFFILATAGTIALMLWGKIKREVMLAIISVLVVADLVPVNMRYLNHDDFKPARAEMILPTQADKEIMADKDPSYRVLNLTVSPFNDATTSYFHRSVGGYHGAKLSRYQDIIDNYFSGGINEEILDMLNTRYLIYPVEGGGAPTVIKRDSTNGAAWFVDIVDVVESAHEEIELLGQIDTRRVALVDKRFDVKSESLGAGKIEMVEYRPNYQKYTYNADAPGVALFSEIYYNKGWKAYIDGVESPYFRANYILRGMELPAGSHNVEWRFKAPRWGLIEGITLTSSLIIIIGLILLIIYRIYEKRQRVKA